MNLLTKFDYNNAKKEIAEIAKKEPIEFLRNLHLYNKEKSVEWISEINIMEKSNDSELLEYIKFVTKFDIKITANKV